MSAHRILVATQMMLLEFARRRLTQVLLAVVPPLMILSVYYDLPKSNIAVDVIENTVRFSTIVDQRNTTVAFITLFTISFLAAFFGFYLMLSAKQADRRLILCGYGPFDILAARSIILVVLCALLTIYVLLILLPFFAPKNWPSFVGGMFLCSLIYGLYGKVVGILIARELEGTWIVMVLPFLDTGYLEMPGFSNVLNERWLMLMPGYFPSQITIDSAFTSIFDVGHAYLGGIVYSGCLWLLAAGLFWYATRSYTATQVMGGAKMRRIVLVGLVVAAAIVGTAEVALPYLVREGVEADGHITAPSAKITSFVTGRIVGLRAAEGQPVEAGQELGVIQDMQTGLTQRILVPINGTIAKIDRKAGESVIPGDTLLEIYDTRHMHVELDVEEVFIGRVKVGDSVTVHASGVSGPLSGHVASIGLLPIADQLNLTSLNTNDTNQVKKYPVKVVLDQAPGDLRLDMRVRGVVQDH